MAAVSLYLPVGLAALAIALRGTRPKLFAGCLLSVLWVATSLVALEHANAAAGWWSFVAGGVTFCGMPVEMYLGWVVLWGVVPQVAFRSFGLLWCVAVMGLADVLGMRFFGAVLRLGPRWLAGEAFAVALVLVPALCLARWTMDETQLRLRAAGQVALAGMLFMMWMPEVVFALRPGRGWTPLLEASGTMRQVAAQVVFVLAVPGLAAVMEFAERGRGTPIPYDPPRKLVTSGVYRYCANPMQVSCVLVMLAWAGLLRNGWLVLPAVVSVVYSAGLARWDERVDLEGRFGTAWVDYRRGVRDWIPGWRPYHAGPAASLYVARTCGPCSQLRGWFEARGPVGLEIVDAESLGAGAIRRVTYDPGDGSGRVEGVRAVGRALEHVHLGWAVCGAVLRMPGIWWAVQAVMDASGFGPRSVRMARS